MHKKKVKNFLLECRCGEYYDIFIDNGFDEIDIILESNESDLIEIGIKKVGHRKKILKAIKLYNK